MSATLSKPDYGIDALGVIRNLLVIEIVLLALRHLYSRFTIGPVTFLLGSAELFTGTALIIEGLLMILYSKWGKFRHRDRMLGRIDWKGSEQVLDVGTGRGLLMISAAKHLKTGQSVGIDIWSGKDFSGNAMDRTIHNAELEGVRDRVDVQNGDATAMRFPDNSFDVILSNACIHNIPGKQARAQACREIARVLKPGGKALISDFIHTGHMSRRSALLEPRHRGLASIFSLLFPG